MARQHRRGRKTPTLPTAELTIDAIGAKGDGLATVNGSKWFVPFTLPGDRVRAKAVARRGDGYAAEVQETLARAEQPAADLCAHYRHCGGCLTQHLGEEREAAWKRGRIIDALNRAKVMSAEAAEGLVAPVVTVPLRSRRRADFAARRLQDKVLLGFQRRSGRDVVDITDCAVMSDELRGLMPKLRVLLQHVLAVGEWGGVHVTLTETGPDIVLSLPGDVGLGAREQIAAYANAERIARISLDVGGRQTETLSARVTPLVAPGGQEVPLPARAFLQASKNGEEALLQEVLAGTEGAKQIIELFSGIGTFSLPMAARGAKVAAYELAEPAVAAARLAVGQAQMPMTTEVRDLFENPLTVKELRKTDAVVLDPPRAGAMAQAQQLAAGGPKRVTYVSCHPESFARDVAILVQEGGYMLRKLVPVDQFRFAAHIELVAHFDR